MKGRLTQSLGKRLRRLALLGTLTAGLSVPASAQIATIGNGTFSSTIYNPVSVGGMAIFNPATAPKTAHMQAFYSVEDINAAGITAPGMIDSIAWDVATVPNKPLVNYTIKGKLFYPDSLDKFTSDNLTTLSTQASYIPNSGWSWIHFQTPLYWNGVDNLVFDICSDTVTTAVSGTVRLTSSTTGPQTWVSATALTQLCGVYPVTATGVRLKPNIKIAFRTATCTGVPASVSITPAGPLQGCGGSYRLLQLAPIPSGPFTVKWQQSANGGPWTDITGANSVAYNAQIISGQSIKYHAIVSCSAASQSVTSNDVTINAASDPTYAALPYTQDFENWMDHCNTLDVPDEHWANLLPNGPFSWRREDQGASGGWTTDVTPLYYNPTGSNSSHSARVQTSKGPGSGALLLHLNCSGSTGNKEVRFDYFNKTGSNNPLTISVSRDNGVTYDSLTSFGSQGVTSASWQRQIVQFASDSAKTILKFTALATGSQAGDFDMGIDNVVVYPACSQAPVAGTVDSTSACMGSGVHLSLSGGTASAGLTWQWQEATDGITWSDVAGGNVEHPTPPLAQNTWYRCIVTCTNSGISDTTAPRLIQLSPFYNCYCSSSSVVASAHLNVGNAQLLTQPNNDILLNNGNPLPATSNLQANKHYTNYTSVTPANLYADSIYKLRLTFFTSNGTNVNPIMGGAYVKAWIDYDHNGVFDASEQIMGHQKASMVYIDSSVFTVPNTALPGITGMRIVANDIYDSTQVGPCGAYSFGETEDYLVHIWNQPCTGAPNAGSVTASDTVLCPGYAVTLTNGGYDSTTGQLTHTWQSSTDGSTYADIAGSVNMPVYTAVFPNSNAVWYRVKVDCGLSSNTAYSTPVKVKKSVACYCVSYADGGFSGLADSSDVGGFKFATLNFPLTGGHLNNPDAVRSYTHHFDLAPVVLYADSTYNFSIDHIILRNDQADAKITMFIDYNANGIYDIPEERVYSSVAQITSWHKTGTITIPSDVTLNVPTGMRVILNNDTGANASSDDACGIYTSGETEDFILKFAKADEPGNGIGSLNGAVSGLNIYPNPSAGVVSIQYKGNALTNSHIAVQTITGQAISTIDTRNLKDGDVIRLDMSAYSKGIYILTLSGREGSGTAKVVVQ